MNDLFPKAIEQVQNESYYQPEMDKEEEEE